MIVIMIISHIIYYERLYLSSFDDIFVILMGWEL